MCTLMDLDPNKLPLIKINVQIKTMNKIPRLSKTRNTTQ